MHQKTIQKKITLEGIGLHTGKKVHLCFSPAPAGTGIVFIRKDLPEQPHIPATIQYSKEQMRCSYLFMDSQLEIFTPEHLLAACFAFSITNLFIEMDGPEVPGMDGSAKPFCEALSEAGIQNQSMSIEPIKVREKIEIQEGNATLIASPYSGFKIEYHLDNHGIPGFPPQSFSLEVTPENFLQEIAPARTFVLKREIEYLLSQGLGKGANLQNTLVIEDDGSIFENTPRFSNECVRHKILDLIGDLALLGRPFQGAIQAFYSGHRLNARLVQELSK